MQLKKRKENQSKYPKQKEVKFMKWQALCIEISDREPAGLQQLVWVKQETPNPVSCSVISDADLSACNTSNVSFLEARMTQNLCGKEGKQPAMWDCLPFNEG